MDDIKNFEVDNKIPGKDITDEDLKSKFPLAAKKYHGHKSIIKVGDFEIGGDELIVFAGPNTVENRDMIIKTAKEVKQRGAHFLRAGAYKPLTFPYRSSSYYELREKGIEYLKEAKELTGINVITEIMHIEKIEEISSVSDILQVGTRNMQNYPLLEALGKQKKPVMLKRHYGASLRDWLGAAEYILYNGNPNVILCERGVSVTHTHRSTSRFLLDLQVIPAARDFTHLPIISDPSHATFWADWVPSMCYASVGSGVDGVMVEVHPDPKNAATDPLQPIGFERFSEVINKMKKIHKILKS
tara:strand:- start:8918 stop:9817 length:900 start_codon:yes stop_codon:yes gene_type:complete